MKLTKSTFATAAVLTASFAAAPAMAENVIETTESIPTTLACNGQVFGGDYIVKPYPTVAPIIADTFNSAAGEDIVADVQNLSGDLLLITPTDPMNTDCDKFMNQIRDSGMIEYIEPNYIKGTQLVNP